MSAPDRVAVKMTTGFERNYWGVLTHEFDEDGVVYVREDILDAAILAERERCAKVADEYLTGAHADEVISRAIAKLIRKGGAA